MRLSWNEIRTRACQIRPTNGRDAAYEKGETQSFYNEFFEIFRCTADVPSRATKSM